MADNITPQAAFEPERAITLTLHVAEARIIWMALEAMAREPAPFDCSHPLIQHKDFTAALRSAVLAKFPDHADLFEPIRPTSKMREQKRYPPIK